MVAATAVGATASAASVVVSSRSVPVLNVTNSSAPSQAPTFTPTYMPTLLPSSFPSESFSTSPSAPMTFPDLPFFMPMSTRKPTGGPTAGPSLMPSVESSSTPSDEPSLTPSNVPTELPPCRSIDDLPPPPPGFGAYTVIELESLAMGLKSFSEMSEEDLAAWEAATDEHVLRYWQSILDGNVMSVCTKVEKQLRLGDDGVNSDENGPSLVNANPFDGSARSPDDESMSHHQESNIDEALILPRKRSPRARGTDWDDLIDIDSHGDNEQKQNAGMFQHDVNDPVSPTTTAASEDIHVLRPRTSGQNSLSYEQSYLDEPLIPPQKRSPRSRGVDWHDEFYYHTTDEQGTYGYDFDPIIGNRHLASDTFFPSMSAVPSTSGEPSTEPTWTPQPVVYGIVTESNAGAGGSESAATDLNSATSETTSSTTTTTSTADTSSVTTSQQESSTGSTVSSTGTTDTSSGTTTQQEEGLEFISAGTTTSETTEESYVNVYRQVFILLTNATNTTDGSEAANATKSSTTSATSLNLGPISLTSPQELASKPFAEEINRGDYNKVLEAQGTELSDSSVVIVLTEQPSMMPSAFPSGRPSSDPSSYPSRDPSVIPSRIPSSAPSDSPSALPSLAPSDEPSHLPSRLKSDGPSVRASPIPSAIPSNDPTLMASVGPSSLPSTSPTPKPSAVPSVSPSSGPSPEPTESPSGEPSSWPSKNPTLNPTKTPTDEPTPRPTRVSCSISVDIMQPKLKEVSIFFTHSFLSI